MFNADDYQNILNATGLSEIQLAADENLQREYLIQQRMYHAMGRQGVLPAELMIPMLRMLGFEPPTAAKNVEVIDWRKVKVASRVIVTVPAGNGLAGGVYSGEYCGTIMDGMLGVRIDGEASVEIYAPHIVRLAPAGAKSLPRKAAPAAPQDVADLIDDDRHSEPTDAEIRAQFDPADPTGRDPGPRVERKWLNTLPGDPVTATFRGKTSNAQFIDDGPADGQVTVYMDGQEVTLPESDVEIGHMQAELATAGASNGKPAQKRRGRPPGRKSNKK